MKTHSFHGKRLKIKIGQYDGLCDQKEMVLMADLGTRKGLITAIHESLHAEDWGRTEKTIDRVSNEIGDFLWRLGYRMKENRND